MAGPAMSARRDDVMAMLGLEPHPPEDTYLAGVDEVWIGSRWDIAHRGICWDVYRKGNHMCTVHSWATAVAIVADEAIAAGEDSPDGLPVTVAALVGAHGRNKVLRALGGSFDCGELDDDEAWVQVWSFPEEPTDD